MCYYNSQKAKSEKINLLDIEKPVADHDMLNRVLIDGFDYGNHTILKPQEGKNDFDITQSEWGFIPSWMKSEDALFHMRRGGMNPDTGRYDRPITTLNAIGEEILEKPMYKNAARERRCLVLSSGFFEWRHIYPLGKKGLPLKTAIKYPYYITLPEKEYFFMAGIWNDALGRNSSAILTTAANELMAHVHNAKMRMPTILTEELAYEWMFGKLDDKRLLEIGSTQYNYEEMYAYPIDKDFLNNPDPLKRVNNADLPAIPLPKYIKEQEQLFNDGGDIKQGSLFG